MSEFTEERVREAIDRYHDALTNYVARGGEDHLALQGRMAARGAVYDKRPICPVLRPHFMARSVHDRMRCDVQLFRSAITKIKDEAIADDALLSELELSEGERRLVGINPEFRSFGVLTRLDAIANDAGSMAFVELNAEGAFGVSYADRLTDLFEGFQPLREFCQTTRVTPLFAGGFLVSTILDTWHEFGGTRVPRVAVVDWQEVATRTEFDLVCERFERHGIPARFVDPRDLEYRDGELVAGGEGIDVVYRRALTSELLAREAEVKPLFDAYKARVVCVVNSFRAKLLDKKLLFALLSERPGRLAELLTPDEADAVNRAVPWTRRVVEAKVTGPQGELIDFMPWASENRERLVLKPNDDLGGRGVLLGATVEASAWNRALQEALGEPSVLQLKVDAPTAMFPTLAPGDLLNFERRFVEVDPYLFRGEARGVMARLAPGPLFNVPAGAGTAPVYIVEDA